MVDLIENKGVSLVSEALAGLAALNWGTRQFADYGILEDLLALDPGSATYEGVIGIITIAAVITLVSTAYWNLGMEDM